MRVKSIEQLPALAWPLTRISEAIEVLAQKANLCSGFIETSPTPDMTAWDEENIERWVQVSAAHLEIEAEGVSTRYSEVEDSLKKASPLILQLPPDPESAVNRYLALLSRPFGLTVISPDLAMHSVSPALLRQALCQQIEGSWIEGASELIKTAGVPQSRRNAASYALVSELLGQEQVTLGWLLRPLPNEQIWRLAWHDKQWLNILMILVGQLIAQGLMIAAWWIIGGSQFGASLHPALLSAWALLLFSAVPFQALTFWAQNRLATGFGSIFKQRLLFGTLKLNPDEIRHEGMGQFLGRVMDSEAVEMLGLSGGLSAIFSFINLLAALGVMLLSRQGSIETIIFGVWVAITFLVGWYTYRQTGEWTEIYRKMTNNLVERMVGHRTRLAQENPLTWHDDEDRELDRYISLSTKLDRSSILINIIPSSWMFLGIMGLGFSMTNGLKEPSQIAITLGGILMGSQALTGLASGLQGIIGLSMAWKQTRPIFEAATRKELSPIVPIVPQHRSQNGSQPVLYAKDIHFAYREYGREILNGCNLSILRGERVLLEGPSGGGKSTLAAVLAGLRNPRSGLLLLWGYDRQSLGQATWRNHIVVAPQFHENYIFTETFAFNLLMGRRFPPSQEDLEKAEIICSELGLAELLSKMPSGMQQMVGESGWQLSHGERSRVFIARAILQEADLMIFDESFGALDPENLQKSLLCVHKWAPTLIVIAHP